MQFFPKKYFCSSYYIYDIYTIFLSIYNTSKISELSPERTQVQADDECKTRQTIKRNTNQITSFCNLFSIHSLENQQTVSTHKKKSRERKKTHTKYIIWHGKCESVFRSVPIRVFSVCSGNLQCSK